MIKKVSLGVGLLASAISVQLAHAAEDTQMLRFPDIHGSQVTFSYAGDIWLAPIDGSAPARRLTSHPGLELYPKFSPDGQQIAFTGQYRGDEQVYVIDIHGGEPKQLTYYPTPGPLPARWGTGHQVYGWSPDGKQVMFRTNRDHFDASRLYQVSVDGGLPTSLPMPRAGSGDYSPDGKQVAYSPLFRDFRTWKRYEGGWAQNLFVYDLENDEARQITDHKRTERDPVWLNDGIYYISDRDGTLNLFKYDFANNSNSQITQHDQWDAKWASGDGAHRVVYEYGGRIALYDTQSQSEQILKINVPDDQVRRTARRVKVGSQIEDFDIAPDGQRAVFTARGDVFSVPVEHGVTRNLTQKATAHDRESAWSPDGRYVAFVSDRSGEEEIYIVDQAGGEARQLTDEKFGRLTDLVWSPDSQNIAFNDQQGYIRTVNLKGDVKEVVHNEYRSASGSHWSPDSQWLTYAANEGNDLSYSVYVWSLKTGKTQRVSDGFFSAFAPTFSPDGQYLYYVSDREFAPQIGSYEWNYVLNRESYVYGVALNKAAANPFAPRNDETTIKADDSKDGGDKDESSDVQVKIDFDGISQRVFKVPSDAANIAWIHVTDDHILQVTTGAFYYGRQSDQTVNLYAFDIKEREGSVLAEDIQGVRIAANNEFAMVRSGGGFQRIALANKDDSESIKTDNMVVYRAPTDEWLVVFDEVWRRFRDFFYVPNMHCYDWEAIRDQYRPLVAHVSTREDLNYLMGEMIAELNVGHAYVSGGDLQAGDRSRVDLLGARFELDEGSKRYRVAHIFNGQNEESKYRSPLTEVGVNVSEGDYILAIDGQDLSAEQNPYELLTDRGRQAVELLVNSKPTSKGARKVLVNPISSEGDLVYLEWVQKNYDYVQEKTDGKVGYLHIPDMGSNGIYEFIKWYYPQIRRQGLVVDVRGNGGGNVSSMLIQRLAKRPLGYGYQAHNKGSDTYPPQAFNGHMAALISETSASDGDIFPYFFREAGLGPLIGKLTWGGVVGISGRGPLMDGGDVFVPEFGMGQAGKGWIIEGEGVQPDIEVENDPTGKGDAQLDRGIEEVLKQIRNDPPEFYQKPPSPVKTQ